MSIRIVVITMNDNGRNITFIDNVYKTMHPKRGGRCIKPDYSMAYDIAYAYEADILAAAHSISTYKKRRLM